MNKQNQRINSKTLKNIFFNVKAIDVYFYFHIFPRGKTDRHFSSNKKIHFAFTRLKYCNSGILFRIPQDV